LVGFYSKVTTSPLCSPWKMPKAPRQSKLDNNTCQIPLYLTVPIISKWWIWSCQASVFNM
jgi:hypothetical protein